MILCKADEGFIDQQVSEALVVSPGTVHRVRRRFAQEGLAESVFGKQCLARCIGDEETLRREVRALEIERNQVNATINWHFTTTVARKNLQHIYPPVLS